MTEHHHTADSFLALTRDMYADVSKDDDVYDAIILGRTVSMEVSGNMSLRVTGKYGDHEETAIIDFSTGEGMQTDHGNGFFRCAWFDTLPKTDVACPRFVNCVFVDDVDISGLSGAEFHCCFFLGDIVCQDGDDMDYVRMDGCIIRGYTTLRSCRMRSLKIAGCNTRGILIDGVRVTADVTVRSCHIEESLTVSTSSFRGDSMDIEEVSAGNGISIESSVLICPLYISACRASHLSIHRCRVDSMDVRGVHLTSYRDVDRMVGTDTIVPKGQCMSLDKLIINNGLNLADIVATGVRISDCVSKNGCSIRHGDTDADDGFFDRMDAEVSQMPPHTYLIQVLELSNTRFDGGLNVDKVYNHLGMMDPELDGVIVLDHGYNRIDSGILFGKTNPDCRLFTRKDDGINHPVDPDVLLSLSESMSRNRRFEEAERYYISYKIRRRDDAEPMLKAGMYLHELVSRFGKSPMRVFALVVLAIMLFALLYLEAGVGTLEDCIYFSGYTFFTIGFGEVGPMTSFSKYLTIVEGGTGVVLMTYFVTTMCNKRR